MEQGKYVPEEKTTYGNVKKWIKENYGFNVTNLYIGQVKSKLGLEKEGCLIVHRRRKKPL